MEKTSKTFRIVLEYGAQKKLADHFGVSDETVRRALRYTSDNDLHRKIRQEALTIYNGQEISVVKTIR